ncbi:MAG: hypothetical protein SGJ04_09275 [Bacteroidota bacterium]|nr:hypothetical protein [Bacteroidota bacterium]
MKSLRSILLLIIFSFISVASFAQYDGEVDEQGKTYYDKAKTKVKEIFETKNVISIDPMNKDAGDKAVKSGLYFMYYENGKLKIEGHYKNNKKDGEWKYFDINKKVTKTEKYANGQLVE